MGEARKGRSLPLSSNRALVLDLLHYAQRTPSFPLERICQVGELARLRQLAPQRISWPALFIKAYGLVAQQLPPLRQVLLGWPWLHAYEHPCSVATLSVHRQYLGEGRLCFARLISPETLPLIELQAQIDEYKHGPVEVMYRRQVNVSRLPTWLRRVCWWSSLHFSGNLRTKRLGTFGMSVLAGQGAYNRKHPSVLTTNLTYGPIDSAGHMPVTLLYDHRVIDGYLAAAALKQLEETLRGAITQELQGICSHAQNARAAA